MDAWKKGTDTRYAFLSSQGDVVISEGGGALGKYLCLSSRSVSHIGRAAMDDLQSPQIKRYESEAVVGLTIRTAGHLLPQAHQ